MPQEITFQIDLNQLLKLAKNKEFRKLFPGKSKKQIEEILVKVIIRAMDQMLNGR